MDFAVHLAEILREMRPHRRKLLAKYVNHKTLRAELKPMLKEDSKQNGRRLVQPRAIVATTLSRMESGKPFQ